MKTDITDISVSLGIEDRSKPVKNVINVVIRWFVQQLWNKCENNNFLNKKEFIARTINIFSTTTFSLKANFIAL